MITIIHTNNLTETTIAYLTNYVKQFRKNELIRNEVENILKFVPEKNWIAEIEAIFEYVKSYVRYTRDIYKVETVKTPLRHIIDIKNNGLSFGDCDDIALLLATLLNSAGYKCRFVLLQSPNNKANTFNHILVSVLLPKENKWVYLDATEKDKPIGYIPPYIRLKEYLI